MTSLIRRSGSVTLALTTRSTRPLRLTSRESSFRPALVVETVVKRAADPLAPPTDLAVHGRTTTDITVGWTPARDGRVRGYELFLGNDPAGATTAFTFTFSRLACGTGYTIGVEARDSAGNRSKRTSLPAATDACAAAATPAPGPAPTPGPSSKPAPYRFLYNSDSDPAAAASYGWNLLDADSQWSADLLPAGTRALVWVGDYDNSTCDWEVSDASLSSKVEAMVGDPKVAGFFFSDEPDPVACPNAPTEHRARAHLLHALDPSKIAVMTMDANSGQASLDQIPLWLGAADYIGLDPYPCYQDRPCDYAWIDAIIAAADRAGLPYWGVVQAFADAPWRWPTPAEESHMLSQWAASHQSGYMTFAWEWAGNWLSTRPELLAVLQSFNVGGMLNR